MQLPQYATISIPLLFTILQAVSGRPNPAPYVDLDAPLSLHDLHHLSQLSALTSGAGAKAAAAKAPGGSGSGGAGAPAAGGAGGDAQAQGGQGGEQGGQGGEQQAAPQRRGLHRRGLNEHHAYLARRGHLSLRDLLTKRSPFLDLDAPLTLHDLHHLSRLSALTSGAGAKAAMSGQGGQKQKRSLTIRDLEFNRRGYEMEGY